MQESPGHPGLGIFRGHVRKLPSGTRDDDERRLKVPHIGWARVAVRATHPVLDVPTADNWFYFVHSYFPDPERPEDVALTSEHGAPFCAAVRRGKRSKDVSPREPICIATSATLVSGIGGGDPTGLTVEFASLLFGLPFPHESVVFANRQDPTAP